MIQKYTGIILSETNFDFIKRISINSIVVVKLRLCEIDEIL